MHARSLRQVAAIVLVSLCATASTPAPSAMLQEKQAQQEQQEQQRSSQGFVLDAGQHMLGDIIRSAAKFLGRNYLMSQQEMDAPQNTVEIQRKLNLDVIGCEEVVSQLAYLKGFAIVPIDPERGLYDVISMRGQRVQEIAVGAVHLSPDEVLRKSKQKLMVLTAVPLKHIDAARAAQQLRPFFTHGGGRNGLQFGNTGSNQSLLIQGYASQVAGAIRVLREVDTPDQSTLPQGLSQQLQGLQAGAHQQANAIKALEKRLADLEAQLAVLGAPDKKK